MSVRDPITRLTEAEIRALMEETERTGLTGMAGAAVRAVLGTLALVLAVFATRDAGVVGLALLCAVMLLGLGAYIGIVARSVSASRRPGRRRSHAPITTAESGSHAAADL